MENSLRQCSREELQLLRPESFQVPCQLPAQHVTTSETGFWELQRSKSLPRIFKNSRTNLTLFSVLEMQGSWVSMGVISDGSYGAPEGVVYSFPVTCADGKWTIVQGNFFPLFFKWLPFFSLTFPSLNQVFPLTITPGPSWISLGLN